MDRDLLDDLHAPLLPFLRYVGAAAMPQVAGVVLDVACGAGKKVAWLSEVCGPSARLLGIDCDAACVLRDCAPTAFGMRVVGDALALPLRDQCCAAACCIAALGLFADPVMALCELHRVLRPNACLLLITATQAWVPMIPWPHDLLDRLRDGYAALLAAGKPPPLAPADVRGTLDAHLRTAHFIVPRVRAFLLDRGDDPIVAELLLLSWEQVRPWATTCLTTSEIARCDQCAATSEIELCSLLLVAQANAAVQ